MKQNIFRRIARLVVIQPLLFWLGARPDGLICDVEYSDHPGLLEIVLQTEEILLHQMLSVISLSLSSKTKMEKFYLKKDHNFGYYTQGQMALGLSQNN